MSDFDTRRIGEIATLEEQVRTLQQQVFDLTTLNQRWTPKATSAVSAAGDAKISLQFGGKVASAVLSLDFIRSNDTTSAVTAVIENLTDALIADRLRAVIEPEVLRVFQNSNAITKSSL